MKLTFVESVIQRIERMRDRGKMLDMKVKLMPETVLVL